MQRVEYGILYFSELRTLSQSMYELSNSWLESLPLAQKQQIVQHLGNIPAMETEQTFGANGSAWHWWVIAVLPLDPRIQLAMIAMTSYSERLKGLGKVLGYLHQRRRSR